MQEKQQAISDIKSELKSLNLSFIAFHTELNAKIESIVNEYLKLQEQCH